MIFKRLSCFEGFAVVHKYLQRKENFHVVINYYSKRKLARLFSALTTLYRLGVEQQGLMTLDRWEIVFKANPNFFLPVPLSCSGMFNGNFKNFVRIEVGSASA